MQCCRHCVGHLPAIIAVLCYGRVSARNRAADECVVLQIAPWYGGRINIKYRRVDCTPPTSIRLQLLNVDGNGNWLRMTVQVTAQPHPKMMHGPSWARHRFYHLVKSEGPAPDYCPLLKLSLMCPVLGVTSQAIGAASTSLGLSAKIRAHWAL